MCFPKIGGHAREHSMKRTAVTIGESGLSAASARPGVLPIAAFAVCIGIFVSASRAGTWCDNFAFPIFCDSFDKYCTGFNDPCPQNQNVDTIIKNAWPRNSWSYHNIQDEVCGNEIILSNVQAQLTTTYHGAVMMDGGDEAGVLGQSTRSMAAGIHAKFGNQYDQVLGTDAAPLVLDFDMASNIQSAASLDLSDGYIELALEEHTLTKLEYLDLGYDPEVTPTDYIKVGGDDVKQPGCMSCWGQCKNLGATDSRAPHHAWPTICQSYDARTVGSLCPDPNNPTGPMIPCGPPYCPETPVTKLHKTLAIGALAMLDRNPCHCENPVKPDFSACGAGPGCNTTTGFCNTTGGSARPCTTNADCPKEVQEYTNHTSTNKHVAFFDGWKWRSLSSAMFDDGQGHGIPGVTGSGDFIMGSKIDHVRLTIKTSTVRIDHWNVGNKGQYVHYAGNPLCEPDASRNDTIAGGVTITNPGSGYLSAPTVTIPPPSSGRQAKATATISGGAVTAITITDVGMGYTSAPTITISPPPSGTQATATATLGGAAHYEPGLVSWADNIPRKFLGAFNVIRLGNASSCRLCSADLVNAGGDYANCAAGQWNGTDYTCTEFNQNWHSGATWCKRMSGISGCYGTNIDDGSNYVTLDSLSVTGGTADASVGACCSPVDGTCAITTEQTCQNTGGAYAGGGSTCTATTCIGACCQASRVCTDKPYNQCSGRFQGPNTNCATSACPCHTPIADFDEDGDVDQDDFAGFQRCLTGIIGGVQPQCGCFNRNGDDKIDGVDLNAFSACLTGPGVALNLQNPPPGCVP